MDTAPPLETVLQALNALYHQADVGAKEKASVWLGQMQKSVYAWQIADQLLQVNQDTESCYFAAQTMRTKIQYNFSELPPTSHQSLRDSLLSHCIKINSQTTHSIVTQLCLALADHALQMATWKNAAADLMQRFGGSNQHWTFLLEILKLLPEEINSRPLRLGANRRLELTEELVAASPLLIQLLTTIVDASPNDVRIQAQVLMCLGSWLSVYAIPQSNLMSSSLLRLPFVAMANVDCPQNLHKSASDCICSALFAVEEDDLQKNFELAKSLFEGCMTLVEPYHMSVANQDVEKSVNYCCVFTEMAESFLEPIVATPNQGFGDFRSLEMLLTCIGHHQYEVADITFNFWNRLSELLYQDENMHHTPTFKPYCERLVVALCRHCQFEDTQEGIPDTDDDFGEFRDRSAELVKDIDFIVGADNILRQMFEMLKGPSGLGAPWNVSEAALFVMGAVAKDVNVQETAIVPEVLSVVLTLQQGAHLSVRHASLELVGRLSRWISKHQTYVDPALQFLVGGLQTPKLATVSADSLQALCLECSEQLAAHLGGLIQIVQAIDTFNVSNAAANGLLKGVSLILTKMPHDKVSEGLKQLAALQVDPLNKMLDAPPAKVIADNKTSDPAVWLDRLASIFRYTTPTVANGQAHPCLQVIEQVWPVLSKVYQKHADDVRIIERNCRCVRFAVRCLGKNSSTLLRPLLTQLVELYQIHPHSCCLYLGSILIDEYGTEPACIPILLDMIQAFWVPTFTLLEAEHGLRNHPDTVDDLFRLCLRFVQKSPLPFLKSAVVGPLILCSIAACSIDHKDANDSVTKFLVDFIKSARDKESNPDFVERRAMVSGLLQTNGPALVQGVLKACLFSLPSYMIPENADIVYELMLIDRPSVCGWLEQALKALPTESSGGAVTATPQQLADFHNNVTTAADARSCSKAFREFARLYR